MKINFNFKKKGNEITFSNKFSIEFHEILKKYPKMKYLVISSNLFYFQFTFLILIYYFKIKIKIDNKITNLNNIIEFLVNNPNIKEIELKGNFQSFLFFEILS